MNNLTLLLPLLLTIATTSLVALGAIKRQLDKSLRKADQIHSLLKRIALKLEVDIPSDDPDPVLLILDEVRFALEPV